MHHDSQSDSINHSSLDHHVSSFSDWPDIDAPMMDFDQSFNESIDFDSYEREAANIPETSVATQYHDNHLDQSINRSILYAINPSIDPSIAPISLNQSVNQSNNQLLDDSIQLRNIQFIRLTFNPPSLLRSDSSSNNQSNNLSSSQSTGQRLYNYHRALITSPACEEMIEQLASLFSRPNDVFAIQSGILSFSNHSNKISNNQSSNQQAPLYDWIAVRGRSFVQQLKQELVLLQSSQSNEQLQSNSQSNKQSNKRNFRHYLIDVVEGLLSQRSVDHTREHMALQPNNFSINQRADQSSNQAVNQRADQPSNQPVGPPINQSSVLPRNTSAAASYADVVSSVWSKQSKNQTNESVKEFSFADLMGYQPPHNIQTNNQANNRSNNQSNKQPNNQAKNESIGNHHVSQYGYRLDDEALTQVQLANIRQSLFQTFSQLTDPLVRQPDNQSVNNTIHSLPRNQPKSIIANPSLDQSPTQLISSSPFQSRQPQSNSQTNKQSNSQSTNQSTTNPLFLQSTYAQSPQLNRALPLTQSFSQPVTVRSFESSNFASPRSASDIQSGKHINYSSESPATWPSNRALELFAESLSSQSNNRSIQNPSSRERRANSTPIRSSSSQPLNRTINQTTNAGSQRRRRMAVDIPPHDRWNCPTCTKFYRKTSTSGIKAHRAVCGPDALVSPLDGRPVQSVDHSLDQANQFNQHAPFHSDAQTNNLPNTHDAHLYAQRLRNQSLNQLSNELINYATNQFPVKKATAISQQSNNQTFHHLNNQANNQPSSHSPHNRHFTQPLSRSIVGSVSPQYNHIRTSNRFDVFQQPISPPFTPYSSTDHSINQLVTSPRFQYDVSGTSNSQLDNFTEFSLLPRNH